VTIKAFLRLDVKNISRDVMLLVLLPVPLFLALLLRFGFQPLREVLIPWFDLGNYRKLILMFVLNMAPLLIGMVSGLLLVDEADDHVIPALAVTPPGRQGFLFYRLSSPYLWTVLILQPVPWLSGLSVSWSWALTIPLILINSLAAPMEAMIIAVFSHNKIEAMAVAKMTGILFMAPFIAWFAPGGWKFFGSILPGFWVALSGFTTYSNGMRLLVMTPALLLYTLAVLGLLRQFDRRIF
jgi:fluoroquinolone transport system permease protein